MCVQMVSIILSVALARPVLPQVYGFGCWCLCLCPGFLSKSASQFEQDCITDGLVGVPFACSTVHRWRGVWPASSRADGQGRPGPSSSSSTMMALQAKQVGQVMVC
jgi:hypothetical protein